MDKSILNFSDLKMEIIHVGMVTKILRDSVKFVHTAVAIELR